MKVIIEANIPFIHGILEPFADIEYLTNDKITADSVRDADALIIRTRTICNAALLEGSKCQFIGTATIGTDHIDLSYCHKRGIAVYNAPGCNAPAVAQYLFSSIAEWMQHDGRKSSELILGVIGVGNVGKIVARWGEALGFKLLLSDPPRERNESEPITHIAPLERLIAESDIITFHTPLTNQGEDATYHLCNTVMVDKFQKSPLVINCARGGITDTTALLGGLSNGKISACVIDCWEDEPMINSTLLEKSLVTTPHIAGYSIEGKMRGTEIILKALKKHFDLKELEITEVTKPITGATTVTLEQITQSYNPLTDTAALKASQTDFESLRNNYHYRHEV
ncbi:MAG: 4-phosphoerythronate dehydrogenase [Bacteroidales bacterium]